MNKKNMFIWSAALVLTACGGDDLLENVQGGQPGDEPQVGTIQVPVHITASGGSDAEAKGRTGMAKVAGTDTGSELTFVWESTDGIEVFAGEQGMTRTIFSTISSGAGTNSAEFNGTLNYNAAENGDHALTDATPVYSYIRTPYTVYDAAERSVTIDLKEQTGTLDDALAHTLFWAESTYNAGEVHFDYQNQMSVMKFNIANIAGETGTGSVTFMADQGMPNAVTCSAKTGAVTPGTGMYVKATQVQFSDGQATVYLAICPNAAQAITTAEVRIDLNGRTFYQKFSNTNIPAGTIQGGFLYPQNVKKAKELKVGDVLYTDGTWGTKAETTARPKSEVLGIVGDINPTQEDIEAGYRHGYAIYREDLPGDKDYDWASQYFKGGIAVYVQRVSNAFGVTYPMLDIVPQNASQDVVVSFLEQESSGLALSRTLYPLRATLLLGTGSYIAYPAAYYAYDEWGEKGDEPQTRTHTFLGTAGEMFRVLRNLGILDTTQPFTSSSPGMTSQTEEFQWNNQNYTAEMNVALTVTCSDGALAMNLFERPNGIDLSFYWTTSEDDTSETFSFYLYNNYIKFDAQQKTDKKMVRPLVAF